jgi:hypothetical protein
MTLVVSDLLCALARISRASSFTAQYDSYMRFSHW